MNAFNQSMPLGAAADEPGLACNHINSLNKELCEWTGIYHIWKNFSANHEWLGVSHYRRSAPLFLRDNEELVKSILMHYDAIAWYPATIRLKSHVIAHHNKLWNVIHSLVSPHIRQDEYKSYLRMIDKPMIHPLANCFIMKTPDFVAYCNWAWAILGPLVESIKKEPLELFEVQLKGTRALAHMSEYLFPIYVKFNLKQVLMLSEVGGVDSHPVIVQL